MTQPAVRLEVRDRPSRTLPELRLAAQRVASTRVWGRAVQVLSRVLILLATDIAVVVGAWRALRLLRGLAPLVAEALPSGQLGGSRFVISVLVGLVSVGAYRAGDRWRSWGTVFRGVALGGALPLWGGLWQTAFHITVGRWLLVTSILGLPLVVARSLLGLGVAFRRSREQGGRGTILVGPRVDLEVAAESLLFKPPSPFRVCGRIYVEDSADWSHLACEVFSAVIREQPSAIVVAGHMSQEHWTRLVDLADVSGCKLLSMGRRGGSVLTAVHHTEYGGVPVAEIVTPQLKYHELAIKRAFDIGLSSVALTLLSPIVAAIAIAVKVTSSGPVFFSQERVGRGGRTFRILKFRSMWADAEQGLPSLVERSVYTDGRLFKVIDDPRITRLGKFLRRTSLDELPQLLNVFKGEMSLVGPRPPVPREVVRYEAHHYCRFDVKPGMTGPWQIAGRNRITDFEDVVLLEQEYIRNWSLTRDLRILLSTVPVVLRGTGAA